MCIITSTITVIISVTTMIVIVVFIVKYFFDCIERAAPLFAFTTRVKLALTVWCVTI